MPRLIFALTSFVLSLALAQNQSHAAQTKDSRVPFQLLPGYKIKTHSGFEGGLSGTIWKEGGPAIEFNSGLYTTSEYEEVQHVPQKVQNIFHALSDNGGVFQAIENVSRSNF